MGPTANLRCVCPERRFFEWPNIQRDHRECFLQLVYLSKFYWWESGYMSTVDIMHDRAGYYICWGCLVWVPTIYTITSQYIYFKLRTSSLDTPNALSNGMAAYTKGVYQTKNTMLMSTATRENGEVNIFGNKAEYIVANKPQNGKQKTSQRFSAGFGHFSPLSLPARDHVQYLLVRLRRV